MSAIRALREDAGLTQAELAHRAGVSRQMVGAIESGRHLPRVDAALALAAALQVDVGSLFPTASGAVDVVTGIAPSSGALLRIGWVGDTQVTAPSRVGADGWDVADGVAGVGAVSEFARRRPGLVVAGCEPGLAVLERLLREEGMGAVASSSSSASAIVALAAGRVHAAVVHGPPGDRFPLPEGSGVTRFGLTKWAVGLVSAPGSRAGWWADALSGRVPVIQRETGAGVQKAFLDALESEVTDVAGPQAEDHLAAVRMALATGLAAVSIEPAALSAGAEFHALEVHEAQLWIADRWMDDPIISHSLDHAAEPPIQSPSRGGRWVRPQRFGIADRGVKRLVMWAIALVLVAGCADDSTPHDQQELVVSAAASLTDAFTDIEAAYEQLHPDVDVVMNFGGSSALREQILGGVPVDVFASANPENMNRVAEAGEVDGTPATLGFNRLEIAVPLGNPAEVTGVLDFGRSELFLGLCVSAVPCGAFAREVLAAAGVDPSIDTEEPDVRALLTKIEAGELDAGIVYVSDVQSSEKVEGITLDDELNVSARYVIAPLQRSGDVDQARAFVDFTRSTDGQAILAAYGFMP